MIAGSSPRAHHGALPGPLSAAELRIDTWIRAEASAGGRPQPLVSPERDLLDPPDKGDFGPPKDAAAGRPQELYPRPMRETPFAGTLGKRCAASASSPRSWSKRRLWTYMLRRPPMTAKAVAQGWKASNRWRQVKYHVW